MVLYMIGLGLGTRSKHHEMHLGWLHCFSPSNNRCTVTCFYLGDEKDITVKGLEAIRGSKRVFLEHYTAIIGCDKEKLEEFYGCEVR